MVDMSAALETRRPQMFPTLSAAEMERLRRFATPRRYAAGELIAKTGEPGPGLAGILSGSVTVSQRDTQGRSSVIVTHQPGAFMGELAQLSGKPALVDVIADSDVEVLLIPPERLRALMVGEAELGEKIMRALILRRMGLLETGAGGPVIIGREDHPDVIRLDTFLGRNGYPHTLLDPDTADVTARLKIEADGNWTLKVQDVTKARRVTEKIVGTGDDVVIYSGPAGVIAARALSEDNFVVWSYSDSSDLLFNEIGPYRGENTISGGPLVLSIQAVGSWSMNVTP